MFSDEKYDESKGDGQEYESHFILNSKTKKTKQSGNNVN